MLQSDREKKKAYGWKIYDFPTKLILCNRTVKKNNMPGKFLSFTEDWNCIPHNCRQQKCLK